MRTLEVQTCVLEGFVLIKEHRTRGPWLVQRLVEIGHPRKPPTLPRQDIGVEKNKQTRSRIRGRNVVGQREACVLREDDHTQRETIKPEQSLGIPDHVGLALGGIEHIDQISPLQIAVVRKLNDLVLHQVYATVERYQYRDSRL